MQSSDPKAVDAGFTLIEALVALVIAGLASAAIAAVFATGLLGHRLSDEVAAALTLAEGKIAAAGETLRPSHSEGFFAGGFHWEVTVAPYDDGDGRRAVDFDKERSDLRIYRIAAIVIWREGSRQRQLQLTKLRLAAAPP